MKPGWQTSENAQTAGSSAGILYVIEQAITQPGLTMPQAIVLAAGCLAVAGVVVVYSRSRSAVKGAGGQ